MKNNAKIVIAVICFAIAGVAVAYQFGVFDSSGAKKKPAAGTAVTNPDGTPAPGNVAPGSVGIDADSFRKPTG